MKGLGGEFKKGKMDMGNYEETLYLWEMVANILDYEPWSEEEQAKARELRTPSSTRRHRVGRGITTKDTKNTKKNR